MSNTILNTDFLQPKDAWDALPLQQKAEMMRVAIRNGIHDLPTIRQKYNEFAEGGVMEENLYAKGGPKKQYGNAGSQKAMQFFMNKGLTQAQAAGLVGNLMRESGMQSTALNSSSKAYGIAQWLGPRKKALFAKYGSNPTFDQQLDFVWHELNTTHKNGLRHLKASKTAAEAAKNVMGYYEFSAGPEAAIAAMNRTGQAGNKSMQIGIENASRLLGVPVPTGEYVQQEVPVTTEIPQNTFQFTPWNPQVFYGNQTYQAPQIELPLEQTVPETTPIITQEQLEKAERQQGLDTFAALSSLFQSPSSNVDITNVISAPKRTNPYVAYQNGGNLFDWGGRRDVYNNKRIYDILPKLYALDGVNTVLSSGKRPGSVVIENGKSTGRVSRHASGQAADIVPGKGSTFADMFRVLRDPNSHVSRYLQSLGGGYIDETSATGTTKYWHDHDRDHSHIHHQIGGGAAAKYKSEIASILKGNAPAVASTQAAFPTFDFVPSNPQAFFTPIENFQQPIERPVIQAPTAEDLAREQRMQEIEERRENLNRFGLLLGLSSPSQGDNSLMQTIGLLSNNMSAHGGHIHIAPSKKGTFTAAATKHGMGVQEFASKVLAHPENYSPAMRKKANFARNASKWHGLGGNLYDGTSQPTQQMQVGKDYWSQLANGPTWLDTFVTPINGGQLSEVVVKPTNDESWLFSLGRYARNSRKPLADSHTRKVVANYLSRFDNESAKGYNARISRLADILDIRGVQFTKNNVESGKLKNRAHYDNKSNTAYIDDMQDIFAEVAHPWQDALGNNNMNDEFEMGNYDPDIDRRGGTRYAYPDTFEGETHGFFQPAITEWVETGKIGRSLPLLSKDLSNEKIVPKDNKEVLDSAASWNRQATDKRLLANPHQLPLTKRIQYSIWDYPLLNKKKALGGHIYDGVTEPTQQMDNSYSYTKPLSNVYVDSEGNVLDPDVPSAKGTIQLPEVTVATPDWKDVVGRYSIASNDILKVTGIRPYNTHLRKQAEEGAAKRAAWAKEHPWLETAGLIAGAAPLAVAATPAIVGGGEFAATALANPYVDAGITSAFAGHGLNHAINEGINGIGDAAMTALEVAPLGRMAKPLYEGVVQPGMRLFNSPLTGNWTKIGNREYRLSPNGLGANGAPIESREAAIIVQELPIGENRYYRAFDEHALDSYRDLGVISQFNKNGFSNSRFDAPHFSKGAPLETRLQDPTYIWAVSKPNANLVWESKRGSGASYYYTPTVNGEYNAAPISEFDFYRALPNGKGYVKLTSDLNVPEGINLSSTPHIDYLNSLNEQQQIEYLTNNGLNSQWLWTLKNRPEHLESALSKAPIPEAARTPQITAENAASITPAQWTAAQDAAITRGDMAEAQRLRDLHFKVNAPNTQIIDKNGNPIHSYHGTGKHFNEFDVTGKYSTLDKGYYGKGAYFAPNKEIAQMYADTEKTPVIYDTYLNVENPLRHVRDENADLYGKVITGNDGVISKLPDDLVDETFDMTEYVATKPNKIKLADAVTYDDNGVRIPLGERDNFKLNDIRYGLLPFLGLGAAGTLYKKQE